MKSVTHTTALRIQELLHAAVAAANDCSVAKIANPVRLFLATDLQRFTTVWATAGAPFPVLRLTPEVLAQGPSAGWYDIRLDARNGHPR